MFLWVICLPSPVFLSQSPRENGRKPGRKAYRPATWGESLEGIARGIHRLRIGRLSVSSARELQKRTPNLASRRFGDNSTSSHFIPEADDSRRRVQVDHRQVFWLPGHPSAAPSHRDTKSTTVAFEQRSSPVTAARPRPTFTAFPEPDHSPGKPVTQGSIRAIAEMSSLFRRPWQRNVYGPSGIAVVKCPAPCGDELGLEDIDRHTASQSRGPAVPSPAKLTGQGGYVNLVAAAKAHANLIALLHQ